MSDSREPKARKPRYDKNCFISNDEIAYVDEYMKNLGENSSLKKLLGTLKNTLYETPSIPTEDVSGHLVQIPEFVPNQDKQQHENLVVLSEIGINNEPQIYTQATTEVSDPGLDAFILELQTQQISDLPSIVQIPATNSSYTSSYEMLFSKIGINHDEEVPAAEHPDTKDEEGYNDFLETLHSQENYGKSEIPDTDVNEPVSKRQKK